MFSNVVCINCGKHGHYSKQCNEPVTSYGIIAVKLGSRPHPKSAANAGGGQYTCPSHAKEKLMGQINLINDIVSRPTAINVPDNNVFYLMIQRRDTIGFIDFLRGKYSKKINADAEEMAKARTLVGEMTCFERYKLRTMTFDDLWDNTWRNKNSKLYKHEKDPAKKKFEKVDVFKLLSEIECGYVETEIGFPKGRRNPGESEEECALREFHEETGYSKEQITLFDDTTWVEEFAGTDGVRYRLVYALALIRDNAVDFPDWKMNKVVSMGEISRIKWLTKDECCEQMRPYDEEKRKVLGRVHSFVMENLIYQQQPHALSL